MPLLTSLPEHRRELAARDAGGSALVVVALCAAWCNTCSEFRSVLDAVALARPQLAFVWLDIEDDADLCTDLDIDNFPTLVVYRGDAVLHYGMTVPLGPVVGRLVDALALPSAPALRDAPAAVRALRAALLVAAAE